VLGLKQPVLGPLPPFPLHVTHQAGISADMLTRGSSLPCIAQLTAWARLATYVWGHRVKPITPASSYFSPVYGAWVPVVGHSPRTWSSPSFALGGSGNELAHSSRISRPVLQCARVRVVDNIKWGRAPRPPHPLDGRRPPRAKPGAPPSIQEREREQGSTTAGDSRPGRRSGLGLRLGMIACVIHTSPCSFRKRMSSRGGLIARRSNTRSRICSSPWTAPTTTPLPVRLPPCHPLCPSQCVAPF
jgi:hypothetical protein